MTFEYEAIIATPRQEQAFQSELDEVLRELSDYEINVIRSEMGSRGYILNIIWTEEEGDLDLALRDMLDYYGLVLTDLYEV
tara:strand:+ start:1382 stop:1624 length:243 start_codon:yes stop_codon:yes gene_type:complete